MTEKQPEALRLAHEGASLVAWIRRKPTPLSDLIPHLNATSDELRRLHTQAEEFNHLLSIERMARETLQKEIQALRERMLLDSTMDLAAGMMRRAGCAKEDETPYEEAIARIKRNQANCGAPGFNEYGVPLHACYGHRHDEHYWERIAHIGKKAAEAAHRLAAAQTTA